MKKNISSIDTRLRITLLGCGNMGGALLSGWLHANIKAGFTVIKPSPLPQEFAAHNVKYLPAPGENLKEADILVLAVKPQMLAEILPEIAPYMSAGTLVISTAAGWTLSRLQSYFSEDQPIIRSLPNLPAAIGKGMTLAVANNHITKAQKKSAQNLLECAGLVEWLDDENLMNAASMISGAGPAFPFLLTELMTQAGVRNGVPAAMAGRLARQTVIGAAALMEFRGAENPEDLRKSVTSPGGVTEAALEILMNGEVQGLFDRAIAAGAKRGSDLNK